MKPLFKHDCTKCTFIGTIFVPVGNVVRIEADLWKTCSSDGFSLRFSDEGADYESVPREYLGDIIFI